MWRVHDRIRIAIDLIVDGLHDSYEAVKRLLRLRLRRFNHQSLGHNKGEVHRGRVNAVVE